MRSHVALKIGMVSGYDPFKPTRGGAEISFYILAKALASLGVEVHVIASASGNRQRKVEIIGKIHVHRVLLGLDKLTFSGGGIASVMLSSHSIRREIESIHRKEKFDLIHSCNRNSAVGSVLASQNLGIPCVLHVRDYWPFCPTTSLQRYYIDPKCGRLSIHCINCHFQDYRRFYGGTRTLPWAVYALLQTKIRNMYAKKATKIIAISNFVKSVLVKNGFSRDQIKVIPNPVEIGDQTQGRHRDKKTVLFVGSLFAYKGVFDAVRAIKLLYEDNNPDVELRIVGDGVERDALANYIRDKDLNYVKIIGKIPHNKVLAEYRNSDLAVLPFKRPEPFGRVIIEAMATGLPVVSYNAGAAPELIKHEKTGILVKLNKVEMLAEAIDYLLKNEQVRKTFGERAKKEAISQYDPHKSAIAVLALYHKLLGEN